MVDENLREPRHPLQFTVLLEMLAETDSQEVSFSSGHTSLTSVALSNVQQHRHVALLWAREAAQMSNPQQSRAARTACCTHQGEQLCAVVGTIQLYTCHWQRRRSRTHTLSPSCCMVRTMKSSGSLTFRRSSSTVRTAFKSAASLTPSHSPSALRVPSPLSLVPPHARTCCCCCDKSPSSHRCHRRSRCVLL